MDITRLYGGIVTAQFQFQISGKPTVMDPSVVSYDGSTLTESVFKPSVYEHRFVVKRLDLVDGVLRQAMAQTTPTLRFRVGVIAGTSTVWLPWQEHLILSHSALPKGTGDGAAYTLHVQTADRLVAWNRSSKTLCRKGKISDIVAAIADENRVANTVIEETSTDGIYFQTYQGDTEFIVERLLRRAVNKKGLANYLFFWQDDTLHFHTPDYQASVFSANYQALGGLTLVQSNYTQKLYEQGIGGVRLIRYDPYTGDAREIPSFAQQALKLADTMYPTDAPQGAYNISYHTGANGDQETVAMAQAVYSQTRLGAFHTTFTVHQMTSLRVGCFVRLDIALTDKAAQPASGVYILTESAIEIVSGKATCVFTLQRGETTRLAGTVVGSVNADNQLVPELEAPGQPLNLSSIGASAVRSGAGKQTSDRTFVVLSDANSGPS